MATAADIRNGLVIDHEGQHMKVVSFQHVKPGKGGAFVRTKLKNIISGKIVDVTFRSGQRISPVRLESRDMQYLYGDGDSFVFMDLDSYEQMSIPKGVMGDGSYYVKEGMTLEVSSIGTEIVAVRPPVFVELEVTETDPGNRGNTASGGTKPAVLETGLTVTVPLFVKVGDVLRIDTRSGGYVERVK